MIRMMPESHSSDQAMYLFILTIGINFLEGLMVKHLMPLVPPRVGRIV
jgi:hypothetical protein